MKKEGIVIAILLILLAVIGGAWIFSQFFNPFQSSNEKHWVELAVWGGQETNYNMTTEHFVITGDEWYVAWDCTSMVTDSHFDITVYDVNTNNMVRKIETPSDQTFNYLTLPHLDAKGTFYLQIFIDGDLGNWHVKVSEFR